MHAHDFIFVSPAGHEFLDVGGLQGLVKGGFNIIGGSAYGRGLFFGFRHGGVL